MFNIGHSIGLTPGVLGSSAWTPADISGAAYFLWSDTATVLKADTDAATNQTPVTTNGDAVYSWTSKGAVTKSPLQVTSSKRPSWNSTSGITFDGSSDVLILTEALLSASLYSYSAVSVFLKGTFSSSTTNMIFLGEGTTVNANAAFFAFRSNTASGQTWKPYFRNNSAASDQSAISATGYRDGSEHVHGVVVDKTNNEVVFYKDGTPESADTIIWPGGTATFDRFFIGANVNQANTTGTEYMAGTVKAIVVAPLELSAGELTSLHTWFTNIG